MQLEPRVMEILKKSWYRDLDLDEKVAVARLVISESREPTDSASYGAKIGVAIGAATTLQDVIENLRQV